MRPPFADSSFFFVEVLVELRLCKAASEVHIAAAMLKFFRVLLCIKARMDGLCK